MPPRPSTVQARRRRLALAVAVGVLALIAITASARIRHGAGHRSTNLTVGVAGWQLPAPTSAASAVAIGGKIYLAGGLTPTGGSSAAILRIDRSEEHTSELQSRQYLVCRLLLEKITVVRMRH